MTTEEQQPSEASLLRLVCDIRFAVGDNGKRMQPELIEYLKQMRADADRYRATLASTTAQPAEPMDWPLPCDVTVGHGTMRKGVRLGTLVARMKVLYEVATGQKADEVASRTPKERAALYGALLKEVARMKPGDRVRYVPGHVEGDAWHPDCEDGTVSTRGTAVVHVRFDKHVQQFGWDGATSQACSPEDLRPLPLTD